MWTIEKNELYHHGIMGMKWGKRNGPPYPLHSGMYSAAEKKATKRALRQEKKAAKKQKKLQKKADIEEAKRQKILKTGTAKQLQKLKGNISNDEYQTAFKRLENERKLDELTTDQVRSVSERVNEAKNVLSSIDSASKSAVNIYNRGARIYNVVAKKRGWEPQELPIIPSENSEKKDKDKDKK